MGRWVRGITKYTAGYVVTKPSLFIHALRVVGGGDFAYARARRVLFG